MENGDRSVMPFNNSLCLVRLLTCVCAADCGVVCTAMDEEDACEVKEVDVDIGNIPLRIFNYMLDFIYTGTPEAHLNLFLRSLRARC